jgi:C-terminal processing protease CtpA/Prc
MHFKLLLLLIGVYFTPQFCFCQTPPQFRTDFNYFWNTINDEYCYFAKKQTNWEKVKEIYTPALDTIKTRDQFVALLEKALYEIYDHHAILNTNTNSSQRLVPSGTDVWAEFVDGKPIITEIRKDFGSQAAGIKPGMEVIAVNNIPVATAIETFLAKAVDPVTIEARNFALRLVLAGNHHDPRKFTLQFNGATKDYFPDQKSMQLEHISYTGKLESRKIGNTGYIRINDCLYDNDLIPAFDSVMQSFSSTQSMILDLRETPSGGNTTVARAILGWFINKDHFYQKHEYYSEEKSTGIKRSWEEIVSPRPGRYYSKPLVILCDHWTGSIAEGIVIGFDALNRAKTSVIGTELARLNGAVYSFEMPETHIHFTFPAERLYHINGLPREQYLPSIYINWRKNEYQPGTDIFIEKAIQFLNKK